MILLVGLGNPSPKYEKNRHNVGFMVIDELVDDLNAQNITKSSFKGELYKTKDFLLLKPLTYMNLSGESVTKVKEFYKIERVIVIHDELDIEFGSIRLKIGGSNGGHNGLKSIDQHIGNEYERIRVGIGRPDIKSQVTSYVLSNFNETQTKCLPKLLDYTVKIATSSKNMDIDELKKKFSTKKSIC